MDSRIQSLLDHPLHRFIGVTGVKAVAGKAEFSVPAHEDVVNHVDVFHGGVIYLLCDISALFGLLSILENDKQAATHNIHVSLFRPAVFGMTVQFKSEVIKVGSRVAFVKVDVVAENSLIATAQVTKSIFVNKK